MGTERCIWLVGLMGAGKSTLGPALAGELGRPFVDTDCEIEKLAGCSVAEIFEREGEAAFRAHETQVIADVPDGAVAALGGGAICQPGAGQRLAERGIVVYLKATPERLLARIGNPSSRPLLAGLSRSERLARLRGLLVERSADYESAGIVLDVGALDVGQWIAELLPRIAAIEASRTSKSTDRDASERGDRGEASS